jgi:hypothetical protein
VFIIEHVYQCQIDPSVGPGVSFKVTFVFPLFLQMLKKKKNPKPAPRICQNMQQKKYAMIILLHIFVSIGAGSAATDNSSSVSCATVVVDSVKCALLTSLGG